MITIVLVFNKETLDVAECQAYQEGSLNWEDIKPLARAYRRDLAIRYPDINKYSILEGYAESVAAFFQGYPEYAPRKSDWTYDTHRLEDIVRKAEKEMKRG